MKTRLETYHEHCDAGMGIPLSRVTYSKYILKDGKLERVKNRDIKVK